MVILCCSTERRQCYYLLLWHNLSHHAECPQLALLSFPRMMMQTRFASSSMRQRTSRKCRKVPEILPGTQGSLILKKFWPDIRTFYVPGGIVSGTCPTEKMSPCIQKDNIPIHMLGTFTKGMFPARKWECLVSETTGYNHDDEETKSRVSSGYSTVLAPTIIVCTSVICAVKELTQCFCTL